MKILVVSGFLGAGKTTFIKNLISKSKKQLVILENEFGDDNLDSNALRQAGELEILEFMEGCVCCSKKDSFINTLLTISASLDPEYLIVEPSGLGKLSNILDNIEKISYEKIQRLGSLVILSPRQINEYLNKYPEIYLDQIKNAQTIVFSKIENENKTVIEQAINKIKQYNKSVTIIDTPYQDMDDEFYNQLLTNESTNEIIALENDNEKLFDQFTTKYPSIKNISELIVLLEDILHKRYGDIIRAKGELFINQEKIRFDLADNLYGIISTPNDNDFQQCVFIGNNIDKKQLGNYLRIKNRSIDYIGLKAGSKIPA